MWSATGTLAMASHRSTDLNGQVTAARSDVSDRQADTTRLGVMLAIADFPMLCSALRSAIDGEADMWVVAESTDRDGIAELARSSAADVIVLECATTGGPGCGTATSIETIRAASPDARIIALDCRCAMDQFSIVLKAGADGFLTRDARHADVVSAIRNVAAGHTYVSPAIVTRIVDTYVRKTPHSLPDDPYQALTEREREVLLLAAMGHTTRDIARSLHLSEQTVHYNRANVMGKLDLHDRVELLRYSIRRGLLDPSTL